MLAELELLLADLLELLLLLLLDELLDELVLTLAELELAEIELLDDSELLDALDTLLLLDTLDELDEDTLADDAELELELSSIDKTLRRSPDAGPGNCSVPVWKLSTSCLLDSPVDL